MTFEDFAEKVLDDKKLLLELVHTAFVAQSKVKGQLSSGVMEKSRAEYDALIRFYEGIEPPTNLSEVSWVNDFCYYRGIGS